MTTWRILALIDLLHHCWQQNVANQCALSTSRNTRDRDETSQRNRHIDILQVVLLRTANNNFVSTWRASNGRNSDGRFTGEVISGDRFLRFTNSGDRTAVHNPASVFSGTRSDVDNPIALVDGFFIMLDNNHCVAEITQSNQGFDEATVVALVQADTRLIQYIQGADQP